MNTKTRKTGARLGALLLSLCLMIGLLPMTAFAEEPPIQRNTYNVYAENVINGGADSLLETVAEDLDVCHIFVLDVVSAFAEIRPYRGMRLFSNLLDSGKRRCFSAFLNFCHERRRHPDFQGKLSLCKSKSSPSFLQVAAKDFL